MRTKYLWLLIPLVVNCGAPANSTKEPKVASVVIDTVRVLSGKPIDLSHLYTVCDGPSRRQFRRMVPVDSFKSLDYLRDLAFTKDGIAIICGY